MRKKENVNDFLNRININSKYSLQEVKYNPIIEDGDKFDEIPIEETMPQPNEKISPNLDGSNYMGEADDEVIDPNNLGNEQPPSPEDNNPNGMPMAGEEQPPSPEGEPENNEMGGEEQPDADREFGNEEQPPESEESPEDTSQKVDELQNEIMLNNIAAMESMANKLDGLDQYISQVTQQLEDLNTKVKEVEEPTNVEKMLKQKDVSYPFYFNLNDYWKGNFFDQRREELNEKGIKELPDGTYIADFDDLYPDNEDEVV